MIAVTATELQSKTASIIEQALVSPIQVTRNNRSVIVLISNKEYERLKTLEDAYRASVLLLWCLLHFFKLLFDVFDGYIF